MPLSSASLELKTEKGVLSGEYLDGVLSFKGIPYAAPPVGARRWCPPEPAQRWQGVRDATRFASDCVQIYSPTTRLDSGRSRAPGMSEDCLYLNIWAPSDSPGANLPVFVWFHGGGFVRGSAAEPTYDGAALARRGAIVVSVNYRLGAFGFFAHPALTRESEHGASGNYGLMDAVAALKWVRDNIAAFGGNPDKVTISGQSAGGAIVGNLLVTPLSDGLFQRAIAMSPGSFRPLALLADSEEYGRRAGDDIDALRQLSAEQVLALNANYVPKARGLTTPRVLRPIVDGWVIPAQEMELFLSGRFHRVPLIVGTCEDEGSMLVGNSQLATLEAYRNFVNTNFGAHADEALALYPASNDGEVLAAYEAALGDSQFHYAARSLARVSSHVQPNTYRYLFTRQTGGLTRPAEHCDEMPYIFGTLGYFADIGGLNPPSKEEWQLAHTMQDAWIRFMETGDPNGEGLIDWESYDQEIDESVEFGTTIRTVHDIRRKHMDLLDRTYGLFR